MHVLFCWKILKTGRKSDRYFFGEFSDNSLCSAGGTGPKRRSSRMKYQVQENCLTIYLPREVDHHNAEEMKREADAVIDRNHIKYVIFDFERTDFMDSSGIGVIMGRYKTISLIGGEVWAVHANARIRKILTLSGATKIMQIYEEEKP